MNTTIQIHTNTLERLKMFKQYERESYDFALNRLLDESREDVLSADEILEIQESLEEVKKGQITTIEDAAKELGITLA